MSEEGDNIEDDITVSSLKANCVNFHIPYGFMDGADVCTSIAKQIAASLGWELYDPQSDRILQRSSNRATKP